MARRANREGSISRRKDGRWEVSLYVTTASGQHRRQRLYRKTRAEAAAALVTASEQARRGIPTPDKSWRIDDYLDRWLKDIIAPTRRQQTFELYERTVRLHLKPLLGHQPLIDLSVSMLQAALNEEVAKGKSNRTVHLEREVLSSAIGRAMREELVTRNVARLVELPGREQRPIVPWSSSEAASFLAATGDDRFHLAYLLLLSYGMRRGEVLGLRWSDIDFEAGVIRIEQQVQRSGIGLFVGPVKTAAGRRQVPIIPIVRQELLALRPAQFSAETMVLQSDVGTAVEPKTLANAFHRAIARAGLRRITIHNMRHTTATLLKHVDVPIRDVQLILGHANASTTQQLYQHGDLEQQSDGLNRLNRLLMPVDNRGRCRQNSRQTQKIVVPDWDDDVVDLCFDWLRGQDSNLRPRGYEAYLPTVEPALVTEAKKVVRASLRQRLVGLVAVKIAVNFEEAVQETISRSRRLVALLTLLPDPAIKQDPDLSRSRHIRLGALAIAMCFGKHDPGEAH